MATRLALRVGVRAPTLHVLVGVLLLLLAWSFRLDMYSLLIDGSGPDDAFSYVDHHVGMTGDLLLVARDARRGG